MIEQHCYTRAAKGLFRKSAGYDTVARSAGLDESFIKERLHPFCYYHPSKTLQALRVPAEEFPRSITLVHFPNGKMLLGQTVYLESDFTGQRPTFFTHNYVMPNPEALTPEVIGAMLYKTAFLTETEWEQLPVLEELPSYEIKGVPVGEIPFDDMRLRQLLYVLLEAVNGAKKVYVIVPGEEWVYSMLMWLYSRLPADAANILGFTTFNREPENKKFLHLIFMGEGSLSPNDARVERDYVFDFDSKNFSDNLPDLTEEDLQRQIADFAIAEDEKEPEPVKVQEVKKSWFARLFGNIFGSIL